MPHHGVEQLSRFWSTGLNSFEESVGVRVDLFGRQIVPGEEGEVLVLVALYLHKRVALGYTSSLGFLVQSL